MATAKLIKGKYYGYYRDPNGKQRSAGGAVTKAAALRLARRAEDKIDGGTWRDPISGRMKFEDYVENIWWPNHQKRWEISTQVGYRSKVDVHLIPHFGAMRMEQIRHSTIQSWVAKVHNGENASNVHAVFCVLRVILRSAVRDEVMPSNPSTEVQLPKVQRKTWRILEPGEADAFELQIAPLSPMWRALILLEMELGARFSELRALRPRHLNQLRSRVTICETVMAAKKMWLDQNLPKPGFVRISDTWYLKPYTKDGSEHGKRVVAISPALMRSLLDYVNEQGIGPDDLIFTTRGGLPINASDFRRDIWHPLLERTGLDGRDSRRRMRPHDLRHTAASWALDGGASLAEVMEMMGHRQISTTQLYTHTMEDAPDNVLAARQRARAKRATA